MDYDEIDEEVCALMREHGPDGHIDGHDMLTEMVVRRVSEAVAAERERCIALLFQGGAPRSDNYGDWANVREAIKNGLRAARTEEL